MKGFAKTKNQESENRFLAFFLKEMTVWIPLPKVPLLSGHVRPKAEMRLAGG